MAKSKELTKVDYETAAIALSEAKALTPAEVAQQILLIQQIMKDAMTEGVHFGKIPGCGDKPTLLKPGGEKLNLTFRMDPQFEIERLEFDNGHREYIVTTTLYSITTGKRLGSGVGSCSSKESKYRYINQERICPSCGKPAIIKGKEEYGGGWLCWKKKEGCGNKYSEGDPQIEDQEVGKVEREDIADVLNTVLKISKKRSMIDAILTVTAASDIFTQDIEEMADIVAEHTTAETKAKPVEAEISPPKTSTKSKGGSKSKSEATPEPEEELPIEEAPDAEPFIPEDETGATPPDKPTAAKPKLEAQRLEDIFKAFKKFDAYPTLKQTKKMLEKHVGKPWSKWEDAEVHELQQLYVACRDAAKEIDEEQGA